MKTRLVVLLPVLCGLAFAQIEIRLSLKVVVDPSSGSRPPGVTDTLLTTAVTSANVWLDSYWRGYRFRLTEIVSIGGPSQGGINGPSKWFGANVPSNWAAFESDAQTDPRYLFRTNQVNFYITAGPVGPGNSGGACPIANNPADAGYLACFAWVDDGPWWLVHETGHFFGLYHTFGGAQCSNGATTAGDDGIRDTLPEIDCWTETDIMNYALNNVGGFNTLPVDAQLKLVDDTYFNTMSYHSAVTKNTVENRRTELQLDRIGDTASGPRRATVSGTTWVVSPLGSDCDVCGFSLSPFRTLGWAAQRAGAGDVILLRPAAYNEALTINKPVTLRATRQGPVAIGTAVVP